MPAIACACVSIRHSTTSRKARNYKGCAYVAPENVRANVRNRASVGQCGRSRIVINARAQARPRAYESGGPWGDFV